MVYSHFYKIGFTNSQQKNKQIEFSLNNMTWDNIDSLKKHIKTCISDCITGENSWGPEAR